ncbi:MAG: hypothetical protein Q4Q18_03575 [Methanobrevibacter sp.]|nr:hypothetical protein [Methanobrevibacter sp.]
MAITIGKTLRDIGIILVIIIILKVLYEIFIIHTLDTTVENLFLIIIGVIMMFSVTFSHSIDCKTFDFGYFTTKVHRSFISKNIRLETLENEDYKMRRFIMIGDKRKVRDVKNQERKYISYNKTLVTTPILRVHDVFHVSYYEFQCAELREIKSSKIIRTEKKGMVNGFVDYFTSNNILIVFKSYTPYEDITAYPSLDHEFLARNAFENVNLNPDYNEGEILERFKAEAIVNTPSNAKPPEPVLGNNLAGVNSNGDFKIDLVRDYPMLIANTPAVEFATLLRAISMIDNEDDLISVVENSPNVNARKLACQKIQSTEALKNLMLKCDYSWLEDYLIRFSDEEDLSEIAEKAKSYIVKIEAKNRIREIRLKQR